MSIRIATEADIPQILDIYAPYVRDTAISFEYHVPSLAEFTRRFYAITTQFPWLVWEEDGKVMGYAYGSAPFERAAFGWCAEASIYLHPSIHGKGIGKALYAVLEAILALQGYQKVYVLVTTANSASVKFHEAVGYQFTASMPRCGYKLGAWHGLNWLEKQLSHVENPANFPISAHSIVDFDRKFRKILDTLSLF